MELTKLVLAVFFLFFNSQAAESVPRIRLTKFDVQTHGFKFGNHFHNYFGEIRLGDGLCAGMSLASLAYFQRNMKVPQQYFPPADGTPLRKYLYDRQSESFLGSSSVGGWNFGIFYFEDGLKKPTIDSLRYYIDRGAPVLLGLRRGPFSGHQVLAIGYIADVGSFRNGYAVNPSTFRIIIYDPNYPGRTCNLKADERTKNYKYDDSSCGSAQYYSYFVQDSSYWRKTSPPLQPRPPVVPFNEKALVIEVQTGNDDLGWTSRLNVEVSRNGSPSMRERFFNLNSGARWYASSTNAIPVYPSRSLYSYNRVTLLPHFWQGLFWTSDYWYVKRLNVYHYINGKKTPLCSRRGFLMGGKKTALSCYW